MREEHIKVFTGSPVIVRRLQSILDASGIGSVCKNQHESARLAGFGAPLNSAELFVLNVDMEKASPIIADYKNEIAL